MGDFMQMDLVLNVPVISRSEVYCKVGFEAIICLLLFLPD